jgi:hypothetical protein
MVYSCPLCNGSLARRKFTQAIITRMETDCPHCKRGIQLNVHPMEMAVVVVFFVVFLALGLLAYWLQSHEALLAAFGAAMLGSLALPMLERTYLRSWPRYTPPKS